MSHKGDPYMGMPQGQHMMCDAGALPATHACGGHRTADKTSPAFPPTAILSPVVWGGRERVRSLAVLIFKLFPAHILVPVITPARPCPPRLQQLASVSANLANCKNLNDNDHTQGEDYQCVPLNISALLCDPALIFCAKQGWGAYCAP